MLKPPFPHAHIPNLKGFKMVMVRNDGTEVDGMVERGEDGLHYVQDCLGVRLSLADYKGWKHRDTAIPGPKRIYDSNHVQPAAGSDGGPQRDLADESLG